MTTVIIPAAGLASRLRPISNFTSKSMVPINGRPAISYIIDEIKEYANDIRIVYGKSTDIVDYCKIAYPDLPITFHHQEKSLGPLHAVFRGMSEADITSLDDLIIWLGDTIVLDYKHNSEHSGCSVVYGEVNDWDRWCLINEDGEIIDKPIEDPNTDRALVGIYSFNNLKDAYENIKKLMLDGSTVNGEFQISQLLNLYSDIAQIKTNEWYDCGDFPSLYESRARLLNRLSRDDNSLSVDTESNTITKRGLRCVGETNWYSEAPHYLKPFLPTIYSYDKEYRKWYIMEFCSGSSIQDSLVYENLKQDTVQYLINKVSSIYRTYIIDKGTVLDDEHYKLASNNMWINKNVRRFETYFHEYDFINRDDVEFILKYVKSKDFLNLISTNTTYNFIHGDLHFGNILFDFNTGKTKFIDPRGEWDGEILTHGDVEYDIAKMYQSCFGEYMWIVNGVPTNVDLMNEVTDILDAFFADFDINKMKILSLVMMSSCLPFHNDNPGRQKRIWETSIYKLKECL